MVPVFVNAFLGMPVPLSGFQMIVICVATDIAPSLSLIYEAPEGDLMGRPPAIISKQSLIDLSLFLKTFLFFGNMECLAAFSNFFIYMYWYWKIGPQDLLLAFEKWQAGYLGYSNDQLNEALNNAQTVYFVTLIVCQISNLLSTRTQVLSFFQQSPFAKKSRNPMLFLGILIELVLALLIVYLPVFNTYFQTAPIPAVFWFIPLFFDVLIFFMDEIRKLIVRFVIRITNRIKAKNERKKQAIIASRMQEASGHY